jgi:excisionase family DNA binding protein
MEQLTIKSAAEAKGVHPNSIRRAIATGRLPATRTETLTGPLWTIRREDLEGWQVIGHRPKKG